MTVDGNIEVDVYGGFAGEFSEGFGYDVGLVYYTYPGSRTTPSDIKNYPEIYGGLTFKWLEVKQWYTNDYGGSDLDAFYTEGQCDVRTAGEFRPDRAPRLQLRRLRSTRSTPSTWTTRSV